MPMLDRYRKAGGFVALLALVETCAPSKQAKFLELIQAEDPAWAEAIKSKMLDIHRIYSWNDETIAEIVGAAQDLTLAIALHDADEAMQLRLTRTLTPSRRRKIDDLFETHKPTPADITTTHMKIVAGVRKLVQEGTLRFERFDQGMLIDDHLEERLMKGPGAVEASLAASVAGSDYTIEYENPVVEIAPVANLKPSADATNAAAAELLQLKRKLLDLNRENATLRHELNVAKGKLEQIKKIA